MVVSNSCKLPFPKKGSLTSIAECISTRSVFCRCCKAPFLLELAFTSLTHSGERPRERRASAEDSPERLTEGRAILADSGFFLPAGFAALADSPERCAADRAALAESDVILPDLATSLVEFPGRKTGHCARVVLSVGAFAPVSATLVRTEVSFTGESATLA